ncbi:hypothetical protein K402DRAFT_314917, partial [Aulographum hederae CBS 113979]
LWHHIVGPALGFVSSVTFMALDYMKPLFAIGIVLLILQAAFQSYISPLTGVFRVASSVCKVPGSSMLPFCPSGPISTSTSQATGPRPFDHLFNLQTGFQDVYATRDSTLAIKLKDGEAAVRDLRALVEFSELPSKIELQAEFEGYIKTASAASTETSRFVMKLQHALQMILSANKHSLREIKKIEGIEASRGMLSRAIEGIGNLVSSPRLSREQRLYEQYIRHTMEVEEEIHNLITMGSMLQAHFDTLTIHIDDIARYTAKDGVLINQDRDELLAQLWTRIGGNKRPRNQQERNLALLDDVTVLRRSAREFVNNTLTKLQEMSAHLEYMREHVATVSTVAQGVPLEEYIEQLEIGVDMLLEQTRKDMKGEAEGRARM